MCGVAEDEGDGSVESELQVLIVDRGFSRNEDCGCDDEDQRGRERRKQSPHESPCY